MLATGLLSRWLLEVPHADDGGRSLLRELAIRLTDAGVPIWRASYALMTMHPEVLWRTVQYRTDAEMVVSDQPHTRLRDDFYLKSAVALARSRPEPVRVPLGDGELPFPICADLRALGGTDYFVHGLPFSNGQIAYVSYATREPGGFSDEAIDAFEAIRPVLARRLELESAYRATRALLDVYLGKNAARRVYAGAFQRGRGELVDAVIWFSDMRDFTALSDRTPPARVVEILDGYFDAAASAIGARGGEVLKFVGDAILAIFPLGDDAAGASARALEAAEEALAAVGALGEGVAIGVALHRGPVMYGNIGARDRLDFTVISAAVNEASRLESLCKQLGTPLALSDDFVKHVPGADIVDLGEHALKGVKAPRRVYTLRRFTR